MVRILKTLLVTSTVCTVSIIIMYDQNGCSNQKVDGTYEKNVKHETKGSQAKSSSITS